VRRAEALSPAERMQGEFACSCLRTGSFVQIRPKNRAIACSCSQAAEITTTFQWDGWTMATFLFLAVTGEFKADNRRI
jgi:hypothetical protein